MPAKNRSDDPVSQSPVDISARLSFPEIFKEVGREELKKGAFGFVGWKGLISQQKQLFGAARSWEIMAWSFGAIKRAWTRTSTDPAAALGADATVALISDPNELFEAAARKRRLTPAALKREADIHVAMQVAMYFFAILALAHSWYMFLGSRPAIGMTTLLVAAGLVVNGYLSAWRAWQIQNRRIVSLRAAVQNPSTYLVL